MFVPSWRKEQPRPDVPITGKIQTMYHLNVLSVYITVLCGQHVEDSDLILMFRTIAGNPGHRMQPHIWFLQISTFCTTWRGGTSWCSRRRGASRANEWSATTTASSSSWPSSLTASSCPTTCTGTFRARSRSGSASSTRGCSCTPSLITSEFLPDPGAGLSSLLSSWNVTQMDDKFC